MKPNERQLIIMDVLHQDGEVTVKSLVSLFGISAETIRRDLTALSQAGKLQKTHGGAILPRMVGEGPFQQRMRENIVAKRNIAKKACSFIQPGDVLFIDTGTTTLCFAEELNAIDSLTVITNSVDIAKVLGANSSNRVFLLGGQFSIDNCETTGPMVISQISQFRADYAVITIGGLDGSAGVTDYNYDEAMIARAMLKQAKKRMVLSDSSKFYQIAPFEVAILPDVDLVISNSYPDADLLEVLSEARVDVILAP